MQEQEINEKLRPIAEMVKKYKEIFDKAISSLEREAMITLKLDTEYGGDGKIKISLRQDGTVEIRYETMRQTIYFYPLNNDYQPMRKFEETKSPISYYRSPQRKKDE